MPDPIAIFGMDLIVRGHDPAVVNDLCGVLRRPIKWTVVPNAPDGSRAWEGHSGDWIFALADFTVEDQPGYKPGDRGQSVGISNGKLGLALLSDGMLFHHVARFLVENMKTEDVFTGRATMTMDDEVGSEQRMAAGSLDLRFPSDLRRAVDWQVNQCEKISEGGIWGMRGAVLQIFKSRKLAIVTEGELTEHAMHMGVRISFLAMGWTIQESTPHPRETAIAERWAKRYTGRS